MISLSHFNISDSNIHRDILFNKESLGIKNNAFYLFRNIQFLRKRHLSPSSRNPSSHPQPFPSRRGEDKAPPSWAALSLPWMQTEMAITETLSTAAGPTFPSQGATRSSTIFHLPIPKQTTPLYPADYFCGCQFSRLENDLDDSRSNGNPQPRRPIRHRSQQPRKSAKSDKSNPVGGEGPSKQGDTLGDPYGASALSTGGVHRCFGLPPAID